MATTIRLNPARRFVVSLMNAMHIAVKNHMEIATCLERPLTERKEALNNAARLEPDRAEAAITKAMGHFNFAIGDVADERLDDTIDDLAAAITAIAPSDVLIAKQVNNFHSHVKTHGNALSNTLVQDRSETVVTAVASPLSQWLSPPPLQRVDGQQKIRCSIATTPDPVINCFQAAWNLPQQQHLRDFKAPLLQHPNAQERHEVVLDPLLAPQESVTQ